MAIRQAYEIYKNPQASLRDVINYLRDNEIKVEIDGGKKNNMDRSHITKLLESPLYVRADKDIYEYFVSKGVEIIDDIDAFDGIHGLFLHRPKGGSQYIKVGYHEGLVNSETWLTVQDKKSRNSKFPSNKTHINSWLTGLVKCAHCGKSLAISYSWNTSHTKQWRYYIDRGAYYYNGCVKKWLKIRPDEVETAVYEAMKNRLANLVIAKHEANKPDAAETSVKIDILRLDDEIRKLLDKLADADTILFDYIQKRVSDLHKKKSELEEKLRSHSRKQKRLTPNRLKIR